MRSIEARKTEPEPTKFPKNEAVGDRAGKVDRRDSSKTTFYTFLTRKSRAKEKERIISL